MTRPNEDAEARSAAASIKEDHDRDRKPWERMDGETYACYSRFVLYRNTPPAERSMRKLGVSGTCAFRWAKRWKWTARASAWDLWQLELSDALANRNATVHRVAALGLGSAFVRKAERSVEGVKVDNVEDLVNLAKVGVAIERQALGLVEPRPLMSDNRASIGVAMNFGAAPAWLPKPNETQTEGKQNEIAVVSFAEKVLDGPAGASHHTVPVKSVPQLTRGQGMGQGMGQGKVRLAEKMVNAPVPRSKVSD